MPRTALSLLGTLVLLSACSSPETGGAGIHVTLSGIAADITVGDTVSLQAVVEGAGQAVLWRSRNDAIATVSGTGALVGLAPGTTTIVALAESDTTRADSAEVTVHAQVYVGLSPKSPTLVTGGTRQFAASVFGTPAPTLGWASSAPSVLMIDADGLATALSVGTATVTVTVNGDTTRRASTLVTVTAPPPVGQGTVGRIGMGYNHGCGITRAGRAWCWGLGAEPYGGQIGDGRATAPITPTPHPVAGDLTFTAIAVGGYHTCGLTAEGAIYCWGGNTTGQLGRGYTSGTYDVEPTPEPVVGGQTWQQVVTGDFSTCGLTTAGDTYCWGRVYPGDGLGGAYDFNSDTPYQIPGAPAFTTIATDGFGGCGLTSAGAAYCWGHPQTAGKSIDSARVESARPIPGGHVFTRIALSHAMVLAIDDAGQAWTWGAIDGVGWGPIQMGYDRYNDTLPHLVNGGHAFVAMDGGDNSFVALEADGLPWAWGTNTPSITAPSLLDGTTPLKVAATTFQKYVGLTPGGELRGWGNDGRGETGTGTFGTPIASPTAPLPPTFAVAMPNTADVEQGDAVEVPIALERQYGGFTEDGPTQFSGTVTLAKNASIPGATVTLTPTILGAGQTLSTLKVQTTASTPVGNYGVQITASSPGRDDQVIGTIIKVAAPPPSGGGGGGTYVCPGTLPSGYQCVDIPDGRQAPVKYAGLTNGPSGAWNNSGLGVCMNLGANGVATFTYSAGVYGGPTNAQGKWGAMVSSTGVVVAGNGTVYYILTGSTDAQIALQNWDSGTGQWVQGGWEAGGC